jgi:hypothetical protein
MPVSASLSSASTVTWTRCATLTSDTRNSSTSEVSTWRACISATTAIVAPGVSVSPACTSTLVTEPLNGAVTISVPDGPTTQASGACALTSAPRLAWSCCTVRQRACRGGLAAQARPARAPGPAPCPRPGSCRACHRPGGRRSCHLGRDVHADARTLVITGQQVHLGADDGQNGHADAQRDAHADEHAEQAGPAIQRVAQRIRQPQGPARCPHAGTASLASGGCADGHWAPRIGRRTGSWSPRRGCDRPRTLAVRQRGRSTSRSTPRWAPPSAA